MAKSAEAFRTISEVAEWLGLPTHVLRFWESKFPQVKPVKRAGGRRYYRPNDMLLLGGIKKLLHDDGMTIKGAQKILREQGAKHVSNLSQSLEDDEQDNASETSLENAVETRLTSVPDAETIDAASSIHESMTDVEELDLEPLQPVISEQLSETDHSVVNLDSQRPEEKTLDQVKTVSEQVKALDDTALPTLKENPESQEIKSNDNSEQPLHKTSGLPSFLSSPDSKEFSSASEGARKIVAIVTPEDPSDTSEEISPGVLSRLAACKTKFSPDTYRGLSDARSLLRKHLATR